MPSDSEAKRGAGKDEAMMGDGRPASELIQTFEDALSARALLSSIRRHLAVVLAFTLSLCGMGYLFGLGLPTWYEAEGVLVVQAHPQRTAEIQELPDPPLDPNVIQSEVDILKSRLVIEPVVRSLKLWEAPQFQPHPIEYPYGWDPQIAEARLGEMWSGFWGLPAGLKHSSSEEPISSIRPSDSNPPTEALIDATVSAYLGNLTVANDGHSYTMHVSYRALTPQLAATIVNAHIESYQDFGVNAKLAAAERANSALTAQVSQLRQQLLAAEAAVTRYRQEHRLVGASRDVTAQLAALHSQLISVRAEIAENEARAAGIGTGGESLPEVVASGAIAGLRSQEVQLTAREAALVKDHGDQYPELQHVRASLQNVRDQISRQIGRDRAAAMQTVERVHTREQSLQQSIMELTNQLNSADAGLEQLQGNADSIRALLLSFEKRVEETAANPAFITPNFTVASRANPTAALTSSKTKKLALAGGFAGLTLGSLLSLLLELRDKGFRTSHQVQLHLGSVTVTETPRAVGRKWHSPSDIILGDNSSAFAEAFRISWANIQIAAAGPNWASVGGTKPGTVGTVLGITSAASGEGKSVHALAFARTAALAGENVVLVDADLRRSGVSRLIDQQCCFTLRDFLQDRCTADDLIAREEHSGVHFVPSVPTGAPWTSQDLQRFFKLVDYLKARFFIVIIDLPPLLGLAETIRLATAIEKIVLVVRWGRTERHFVQFALDSLRSTSISNIAVVLNDIDLKAQRRRGYRDRTVIYTDSGLYRVAPSHREPAQQASLPMAVANSDAGSEISRSDPEPPDTDRPRSAGSTIEIWYDRYRD